MKRGHRIAALLTGSVLAASLAAPAFAATGADGGTQDRSAAAPSSTPADTRQDRPTPTGENQAQAKAKDQAPGKGGPRTKAPSAAELAAQLVLDEAKVTAALESLGKERGAAGQGAQEPSRTADEARRTADAEALAQRLGVSADDLTAALKKIHENHRAERPTGNAQDGQRPDGPAAAQ